MGEQENKIRHLRSLRKSGEKGVLTDVETNKDIIEGQEEIKEPLKSAEIDKVSDEVKIKALDLLDMLGEYFSREKGEGKNVKRNKELADTNDFATLLEKLEGKNDEKTPKTLDPEFIPFSEIDKQESSQEEETVSAQEQIKEQIRLVLAAEGVKEYFFSLLKSESEHFKKAKDTLKKVSMLERLRDKITSEIPRLYIGDKRTKGKLMPTTAKTISHLSSQNEKAKEEIGHEEALASPETKSWLKIQKLLEYKKQLKETGFAKTESRKNLLQRVLSDITHGNKVFLVGSTGTGKTQLAMLVADLVNDEGFEIVSWHEGTTPRDLFGYREISQDKNGIKSGTKKGPVAIAITDGKIVIHDEYTAGTTRAQLSAKAQMNAKVGGKTKIPGFNGDIFTVEEGYGELFTGNLKDERTKAREDMDPAILRMLKGIKVPFMPADELFEIIIAELIEDTGLLKLSRSDVALIEKLTKAAEIMQMCHDREFDKLENSKHKDTFARIFAGNIKELHLDKSFLDTGTILDMFKGWELEKAQGKSFKEFLNEKLNGQKVFLKFDAAKYDNEGNLLCYLYLKNKTFVNAHLIKNRLATVDSSLSFKYKNKFFALQK